MDPIKKHLNPINLPPFPRKLPLNPQNQLLRSQPAKGSPRKTEVTIHLNMMLLIKQRIKRNYDSCFGTGKAPAVGYPAKGKINGNTSPN
ncbi:hypothetical protein VP01_601g4 [Puccinia sorghi]|uniref:Uncharacterized protein n=1 Tax=Puccinia sorghi TaxID=27349 RepID=A0A0L6UHF5_9BASI|nr:hypothetical protein VP01_601g4 [Puccinia sorghi]